MDGIHFGVRMEDAAQCMLVVIGATKRGEKELLTIVDGYRESEQSWLEALNDLKRRGLKASPTLAIGGGAADQPLTLTLLSPMGCFVISINQRVFNDKRTLTEQNCGPKKKTN